MIFSRIILLLIGLLLVNIASAQEEDSIFYRNDTAYIIKKPVIIKKEVYVEVPVVKETIEKSGFYISPFFQSTYSLDYIAVCSEKRSYFDEIDAATTPEINLTFGTAVSIRKSKMQYKLDINYTAFREQFEWEGEEQINHHNTLITTFEVGYFLIDNNKPFDLMVALGAGYLYTLNYSGNTFDEIYPSLVISQTEQQTLDKASAVVTGKILGNYYFNNKLSVSFGPVYSANLISITQKHIPYDEWRNNIGLMLGVNFKMD
ncbi:hypothetical protein [Chondrinema litorale]|uniref:hypothetical protein n=1 Tax=Chondrinema litorale TaxID=2994555 RepID=UPI0025439FE9|nr:hypothetical protein [Chondrinema litorale]UZR96588.1 hypothetical protein OQ292_20790 [Chondrinema litorale]